MPFPHAASGDNDKSGDEGQEERDRFFADSADSAHLPINWWPFAATAIHVKK